MSSTSGQNVDEDVNARGTCQERVFIAPNNPQICLMSSSPVPSVANISVVSDDAGSDCINPATSLRIGSITHNRQENGYDHEWESRADFDKWLTNEQKTEG